MDRPTHSSAPDVADGAAERAPVYGVRSIGVALKARRLERFFDNAFRLALLPPGVPMPGGFDGMAGWGRKGTAGREAERLGKPYLALEDGFLRTAGLGGRDDPSLSLTADLTGVHYDASHPS